MIFTQLFTPVVFSPCLLPEGLDCTYAQSTVFAYIEPQSYIFQSGFLGWGTIQI